MADKRRLKSIASRYDLEVFRHRDPWRILRARLSYIFAFGSIAACIPWMLADHRVFQSHCVSQAHRAFEQNCAQCHDRTLVPFMRAVSFNNNLHSTSVKKCQVCHRESEFDHVATVKSEGLIDDERIQRSESLKRLLGSEFSAKGCAGCHAEHRGNDKLASVVDPHCTKCHVDSSRDASDPKYDLNFSIFLNHPEFSIWRNPTHKKSLPSSKHVEWDGNVPVDLTAIRFSHHRHLDPELPAPGGGTATLKCAACHESDASGAYFRPINFEQHCHRCHKLGFPSTGELPHAKPAEIRNILLGSLITNLKNNDQLPGRSDALGGPTKPAIMSPSKDSDQSHALDDRFEALVASEMTKLMFESREPEKTDHLPRLVGLQEAACTKCHFTKQAGEGSTGWTVIPPRIPTQWMENTHFRHDRHYSVDCTFCHRRDGRQSEPLPREQFYPVIKNELQSCSAIHASTSARDVLMPRIDVCHQCHGRESVRPGRGSVSDRCVDCHGYHHLPANADSQSAITRLLHADQAIIKGKSEQRRREAGQ